MKNCFYLFLALYFVSLSHVKAADVQVACSHRALCQLALVIAQESGNNKLTSQLLVKISGDPHEFEPSASELKSLINAPVLIAGPHELNPWMKKVAYQRSKIPGLKTLAIQLDSQDKQHYPQGSTEALSHFWLYPKAYCRMKSELAENMLRKQLIASLPPATNCSLEASKIEAALKRTLSQIAVPIVLTHDAVLPLLLSLKPAQMTIVAIKGSGHHEEATPEAVKRLYDALTAKKVLWIEEAAIKVPRNIAAKKRPQDLGIKINTDNSQTLRPFEVLELLNQELQRFTGKQ